MPMRLLPALLCLAAAPALAEPWACVFTVECDVTEGCESTGARMMSSTIMPRAKPPEKHMPIAPMPTPPTSACSDLPRARNQPTIGEVRPVAQVVNSDEMHTFANDAATYPRLGPRPGVPTRSGIATVNPRSTTSSAKPCTLGVIPGISWTTITTGPEPRRWTS